MVDDCRGGKHTVQSLVFALVLGCPVKTIRMAVAAILEPTKACDKIVKVSINI